MQANPHPMPERSPPLRNMGERLPKSDGKQVLIRWIVKLRDVRFCQNSAACSCGTSAEATSPSQPGAHCGREMEGAIARRALESQRLSGEHRPGHRKGPSTPSSLRVTCRCQPLHRMTLSLQASCARSQDGAARPSPQQQGTTEA